MKKVLAMILSLTLVVTLTIGGSIAYLTSEDSDVNVMTLGNVQIEQNEYQRAIDTETGKLDEANIVSFTDNKPLLPAVAGSGAKKQITVDGHNVQIRDDEIVTNYVDKIVNVKNIGKSDAYVRTLYAFPNGGIPHNENAVDASDQWLHWNGVSNTDTTPNNGWIWGKDKTTEWPANNAGWNVYTNVEINGITYDVFIATNKNVIAENEITAPSLVGLYMDSNVDYDNDKQQYVWTDKSGTDHYLTGISLEEPFEVLTLSQGVQADGFTDAWAAFDAAFPLGTDPNATLQKWFGDVIADDEAAQQPGQPENPNDSVKEVRSKDEFVDAFNTLKSGDTIKLSDDIELGNVDIVLKDWTVTGTAEENGTTVNVVEYANNVYNIDLNTHKLSVTDHAIELHGGTLNIKNGTISMNSETQDGTFITVGGHSPVYDAHKVAKCGQDACNPASVLNLDNVTFEGKTAVDGGFATSGHAIYVTCHGQVYIRNCTFDLVMENGVYANPVDVYNNASDGVGDGSGSATVVHVYEGTKFYGDPTYQAWKGAVNTDWEVHGGMRVFIADGYKLEAAPIAEGDTYAWYTVVKE